MKYSAVIFDLFGTLVQSLPSQKYRVVLQRTASALSVPRDEFAQLWFDTAHERNIGAREWRPMPATRRLLMVIHAFH